MGLSLLLLIPYSVFLISMLVVWKPRILIKNLACILMAVTTSQVIIRIECPSNISFQFSNPGQTGTYQKVEFFHKVAGKWIEGPSVEGWPLTVSFPDINSDGFPDIRVVEMLHPEKVIEFIYRPQPLGDIYWKAGKMDSGLSAAYPPAKIFYNYP